MTCIARDEPRGGKWQNNSKARNVECSEDKPKGNSSLVDLNEPCFNMGEREWYCVMVGSGFWSLVAGGWPFGLE